MTADPVGNGRLVWDSLDKFYQKTHSLKLLAISPSSTAGYHIFLKDPIKGSWDGRKIRGLSDLPQRYQAFGGEPVVMPGSEFIPRSKKGLLMALQPTAGMLSMKHFEVAKYRYDLQDLDVAYPH